MFNRCSSKDSGCSHWELCCSHQAIQLSRIIRGNRADSGQSLQANCFFRANTLLKWSAWKEHLGTSLRAHGSVVTGIAPMQNRTAFPLQHPWLRSYPKTTHTHLAPYPGPTLEPQEKNRVDQLPSSPFFMPHCWLYKPSQNHCFYEEKTNNNKKNC